MQLVFLHGFLGSALDFQPIVQRLTPEIECICLDLPGHGRSIDLPEEAYTFLGAADVILSQIAHLEQPALYGYSMGGRLALYLGLTYPDRFSHLFLESTSPGLAHEHDRLARRTQDAKLATALQSNFSDFLDAWYDTALFQTLRHHPSFPDLLDRRQNNDPRELAKALQGMGTGSQASLWEALNATQCPIVSPIVGPIADPSLDPTADPIEAPMADPIACRIDLLVGTCDLKFLALNQKIATDCPLATLNLFPNVGHNIHAEDPEAIARFLRSQISMLCQKI